MKILLIVPWVRQGGAEIIAVKTAFQLQKLGYQIRVAGLFVNTLSMQEEAKKIEYVTFGGKLDILFQKNKVFLYFLGPFFLLGLTLRQALWADILFPHSFPSYWIAPLVGKLYKKKVVWLCNEPPKKRKFSELPFLDFLLWRVADSFLDRIFVKGVDKIIVYSEIIKKEVKIRYKKAAKLVRLGIDFNFFQKKDIQAQDLLKKQYNLFGKHILLMVGKLHPQKNQSLGIEVLSKILPEIKNAVLVLVGEGPDKKKLIRQLAEKNLKLGNKVIFAGFCPPETVRAWYGICDLVLFPSLGQTELTNQSWGFVPFEALCQKKISIVSEGCGAQEVLGKEKIGIICQPEVEDFSKAILDFYKEKGYKKMAKNGYNYVKNNLGWDVWGRGVERIISSKG